MAKNFTEKSSIEFLQYERYYTAICQDYSAVTVTYDLRHTITTYLSKFMSRWNTMQSNLYVTDVFVQHCHGDHDIPVTVVRLKFPLPRTIIWKESEYQTDINREKLTIILLDPIIEEFKIDVQLNL